MSTSALLRASGSGIAREPVAIDYAPAVQRQWLSVDGFITDRLLVSYRAPAAKLRALVPEAFTIDEREGFGFLSVCALEVKRMGVRGAPNFLRFDNRELLYRLSVRYRDTPTFITLRSDTSSRALAVLGARFSHYAVRHAAVELRRAPDHFELCCRSKDGLADARVRADLQPIANEPRSQFEKAQLAADWLIGMSCSVAARGTRVLVQAIEHDAWSPRFVSAEDARFDFVARLGARLGVAFAYDNALHVQHVRQTWRAAQWQK